MSEQKHRFRVFGSESDSVDLPSGAEVEQRYPGFLVVKGSTEVMEQLRSRFPVEELPAPQPVPQMPKVAGLAAADATAPARGPYTVAVRFTPPLPDDYRQRLDTAGCETLGALGSSTVAVSCPSKFSRDRVGRLDGVERVTAYVPRISITPEFFQGLGTAASEEAIATAAAHLAESDRPRRPGGAALQGLLDVSFFTDSDCERAERKLRRAGVRSVSAAGDRGLVVNLNASKDPATDVQTIAALRGLKGMEEKHLKQLWNNVARGVVGNRVVDANPTGLGLSGDGEIVAVADSGLDTGDPSTLHPDFQGRVHHIESFPIVPSLNDFLTNPGGDDGPADRFSGHGTHVCGSVLGDGSRSRTLGLAPIEGVAPGANLVFQAIDQTTVWNQQGIFAFLSQGRTPPSHGLFGIPDDLGDLFQPAFDQGARIHSNSWGGGRPGEYDAQCADLDRFVWEHKDFLVLVAAGNDGIDDTPGGGQGITPGSVTSPATAKNCVTVGACENPRAGEFDDRTYGSLFPSSFPNAPYDTDEVALSADDIVAFSSRGPCTTGRRKPDVLAPGTFVLSTRSSQIDGFGWGSFPPASDDYMFNGGTSMATPLVAGCAALVRQFLRTEEGIDDPSAALMKAVLIHSARYVPYRFAHASSAPAVDNEQGWGRVELESVLNPPSSRRVIFIDDRQGLETGQQREFEIEVTDDSEALRATLVYSDFPGEDLVNNLNLFAVAPDGTFHVGNGSPDGDNNVEGIFVDQPAAGTWKLRVVASSVPEGPQDFALVVSGALGE